MPNPNILQAYYKFDENGNTNAIDSTMNSYNLTKEGTPGPGTTTGVLGSARTFDGVDQRFRRPNAEEIFSIQKGYTIWGWVYGNVLTGVQPIAAKAQNSSCNTNGDEWSLRLFCPSGCDIEAYLAIGGGSNVKINATIAFLSVSVWNFVVLRYNSDTGEAYLLWKNANGEISATETVSSPEPQNTSLEFSVSGDTDGSTFGRNHVDGFGIAKKALTTDEINYIYNAGNSRTFVELLNYLQTSGYLITVHTGGRNDNFQHYQPDTLSQPTEVLMDQLSSRFNQTGYYGN
jgi:hypothetical protein